MDEFDDNVYVTDDDEDTRMLGILSLVFGVLAITFGCCGFCCCNGWLGNIMSTAAIVLGIVSLVRERKAKGMAVAGIICGAVGLMIAVIMTVRDPLSYFFTRIDNSPIEEYVERFEESL